MIVLFIIIVNLSVLLIIDWLFVIMTFLETKLMSSYMMLGHYLGFEMDELDDIQLVKAHDEIRCTKEILFRWKHRSPNATHQIIAEALKRAGYYLLSEMINHHFDALNTNTFCHRLDGCKIIDLSLLDCVLSNHNSMYMT